MITRKKKATIMSVNPFKRAIHTRYFGDFKNIFDLLFSMVMSLAILIPVAVFIIFVIGVIVVTVSNLFAY
jgi:hypothetical protein